MAGKLLPKIFEEVVVWNAKEQTFEQFVMALSEAVWVVHGKNGQCPVLQPFKAKNWYAVFVTPKPQADAVVQSYASQLWIKSVKGGRSEKK